MQNPSDDPWTHLLDMLEQERRALLNGDLMALEDLSEKKTALIRLLSDSRNAEDPQISEIRSLALSNQSLIDEALRGIQSVADRLRDIRSVRDKLDTYDRRGKVRSIAGPKSSIERRA